MVEIKIKRIETVLFLMACIGLSAYLYLFALQVPVFVVKNGSPVEIVLTASWKGQSYDWGTLASGAEREYEVDEEAAIVFMATLPDGKRLVSSPPVYFTHGMVTHVFVSETSIEARSAL